MNLCLDLFAVETPAQPEEMLPWPPPWFAELTKAPDSIQDLGEKIGRARKDMASSQSRRPSGQDDGDEQSAAMPAWARQYSISQIVSCSDSTKIGQWSIHRKGERILRSTQDRTFATREQAIAALPLRALSELHRVVPGKNGGFIIVRKRSSGGTIQVVAEVFASEELAMKYMVFNVQTILDVSTTYGESHLPNPSSYERTGHTWFAGDVHPNMFMEQFALRAVEFGNWNSQSDRQQLLNAAYSALRDLAHVLDLPPQAVGLNGMLGLAFGARGRGGVGAFRAHYEFDRVAMNLTRMKGAGSLAHEWGHGLDHLLSRLEGASNSEWTTGDDGTRYIRNPGGTLPLITNVVKRKTNPEAERLVKAMKKLIEVMSVKVELKDRDVGKIDRAIEYTEKELMRCLMRVRDQLIDKDGTRAKYSRRKINVATEEQLQEFDRLAKRLVKGDFADYVCRPTASSRASKYAVIWSTDVVDAMNAITTKVLGRSGVLSSGNGYLEDLRPHATNLKTQNALRDSALAGEKERHTVPTDFVVDASLLDHGRSAAYWKTPHELFARAFSAYVHDKLAQINIESNFLNHAPDNVCIATPWGSFKPYPSGAERKLINAAFDELFDLLRSMYKGSSFTLS